MTHWKNALIHMKVAGRARGRFSGIRSRRQTGFALIELVVIFAVIAIVGGFAAITIGGGILPGLRANQALSRTVTSLREARMLAMSKDTMVSIEFAPGGNTIKAQILDGGITSGTWKSIPDFANDNNVTIPNDPSATLGSDFQFRRNSNDRPPGGSSLLFDVILGTDFTTGRAVFNEDGFMTNGVDYDSPINGTIYIGTPDANPDLARAVTIRGATGNITAWHWNRTRVRWERER